MAEFEAAGLKFVGRDVDNERMEVSVVLLPGFFYILHRKIFRYNYILGIGKDIFYFITQ